MPQGLVLGPLLFLIYNNDLNHVIKHSSIHHFADDTNLLYSNSSLKLINKHINHMKLIVHWLWANRTSLNIDKTDIILFQSKNKKVEKKLNFCISGQKIILITHIKSLGILLNQHLLWDQHLKMLKQKQSSANGLLAKTRYYLPPNLWRTLYFSIFKSHLRPTLKSCSFPIHQPGKIKNSHKLPAGRICNLFV